MMLFLSHCWRVVMSLVLFGAALCTLIIISRYATSPLNPNHMKPITYFSCIVCMIAVVLLGACANMNTRTSTEYSVIRDLTDSAEVMPDEAALINDLGIDTNIWNGINFSFFNVSDVSYTPHWRIAIARGGNRLASSEFTRKREIAAFKAKLSALLDSARSDTAGRTHSSIYLPVAEELVRLSNSNAERKVLILYSDLMENTPELSFYNPRTFADLGTSPDKVKSKLLAEAKLPDLTGITIHIVHEPKNAKDDATFRRVSEFFRQMFEAQGAEVSVSANLAN